MIEQTWKLYYDRFPRRAIQIPLSPLLVVDSVQYIDIDGVTQTWSSALYQVNDKSEPALLEPIDGESYPTTQANTQNAVIVTFKAGYGVVGTSTGADVPSPILAAILVACGDMYCNRESVSFVAATLLPSYAAIDALLSPYKVYANWNCEADGASRFIRQAH